MSEPIELPRWLPVVAKFHKARYMPRSEFVMLNILAGDCTAEEAGRAWDEAPDDGVDDPTPTPSDK